MLLVNMLEGAKGLPIPAAAVVGPAVVVVVTGPAVVVVVGPSAAERQAGLY